MKMNNVFWQAITPNKVILQQENGKYNNFTTIDKKDWLIFNIINKQNNNAYGIDLKTGHFIYNGINVQPAIQSGVYDIPCIPQEEFDYTKTLFWYNQMISEFNTLNSKSFCQSVYIGYQVKLKKPFVWRKKYSGFITLARPMLKLNLVDNCVSFSTAYIFEYVDQEGKTQKIVG